MFLPCFCYDFASIVKTSIHCSKKKSKSNSHTKRHLMEHTALRTCLDFFYLTSMKDPNESLPQDAANKSFFCTEIFIVHTTVLITTIKNLSILPHIRRKVCFQQILQLNIIITFGVPIFVIPNCRKSYFEYKVGFSCYAHCMLQKKL